MGRLPRPFLWRLGEAGREIAPPLDLGSPSEGPGSSSESGPLPKPPACSCCAACSSQSMIPITMAEWAFRQPCCAQRSFPLSAA